MVHFQARDYFAVLAQVSKQNLDLLQAQAIFSFNLHFYTCYSLLLFYVLPLTRACQNFEKQIDIRNVIDIYDYDYTLKALVGYNKLK